MKFIVENQYNQDAPFPECVKVPSPFFYCTGGRFEDEWELEIRDFEHLRELCRRIGKSAFVEFDDENGRCCITFAEYLDYWRP